QAHLGVAVFDDRDDWDRVRGRWQTVVSDAYDDGLEVVGVDLETGSLQIVDQLGVVVDNQHTIHPRAHPTARLGRTRPSHSAGWSSSEKLGRFPGPSQAASMERGPPTAITPRTNRSPTSYWRIFCSMPNSLWSRPVSPPLLRRCESTRDMRSWPATCSRPRSSITTFPCPSSSDISAWTCASTPFCSSDAKSPTMPPSSSGL